jgi:hypothetical protein
MVEALRMVVDQILATRVVIPEAAVVTTAEVRAVTTIKQRGSSEKALGLSCF